MSTERTSFTNCSHRLEMVIFQNDTNTSQDIVTTIYDSR